LIAKNQKVSVKWGSKNKEHYINMGYSFTSYREVFQVPIEHLQPRSTAEILVICDYCNKKIYKPFSNYMMQRRLSNKDACSECAGKKQSETKRIINKGKTTKQCNECLRVLEINESNFEKRRGHFKNTCRQCSNVKLKIKELNKEKAIFISTKSAKEQYIKSLSKGSPLPRNFWERVEDQKKILDFIMMDVTDAFENKFKDINHEFIHKYKLNYFYLKFKGLYEFIDYFYPDVWKPWLTNKKVGKQFWKNDNNKRKVIKQFVDTLLEEKIINNIYEIPQVVNYRIMKSYGLGGLCKVFNYSQYKIFDFFYPGLFNEWDFHLPIGYYRVKEHRIKILQWFINRLLKDKVIDDINDIPDKVNITTFEKYDLKGFLTWVYQGVSFKAFNEVYPGKWEIWEFKSCPTGFWDKESNIKKAINWFLDKLVEDRVILNKKQAGEIRVWKYLQDYKLGSLLKPHYNIYDFLIKHYSHIFNENNLKLNIAKDGTKLLSLEEMTIHNYFINTGYSPEYCGTKRKYLFNDTVNSKSYIPDWILNNNIIVEYFGYYNHSSTSKRFIDYREKTEQKINFYNNLPDYKFIPLFKEDISKNFKGLKEKLNALGDEQK